MDNRWQYGMRHRIHDDTAGTRAGRRTGWVEDHGLVVVIEVSKEHANQDRTHCDVLILERLGATRIPTEASPE
jgi:hypothetical protein